MQTFARFRKSISLSLSLSLSFFQSVLITSEDRTDIMADIMVAASQVVAMLAGIFILALGDETDEVLKH